MKAQGGLIYDWNLLDDFVRCKPPQRVEFDDETLRDGLQSPSVITPSIEERIRILHLMEDLGLDSVDIGLPGAGDQVTADTLRLAQEIASCRMKIEPNCASRTVINDIIPIIEISQRTGIPVEASLFIGSSPIRQYAEGWTIDLMLEHTRRSVKYAVDHGLPVMYVTEDTTRAHPDDLKRLYLTAIDCGAKRICLADTVGHITPNGAIQLVSFIIQMLKDAGVSHVKIDWHGHNDRGLSVWNCIAALKAGANRVHGTAIGLGERVGNAPMDQILVNLKLMGWIDNDLSKLAEYCHFVSRVTGVPIPPGYPIMGKDAFETATGVHAAAVIKAIKKGDRWLADRVYSSIPASEFGRSQSIRIGPMSGKSNVIYWLSQHKIEPKEELVEKIFQAAKRSNRLLTDEEISAICSSA
jgi:2-isopropylmalate synthase